ncbi:unnamed protein product [Candida verbasci]|uniref:Uncharacterized protein n=1 Tax=Candida verbasci TaxID=1227364 RepID=A0A9W4XBB3_9ASCO|nr:unnamed protein product [Candida verbasci]
MFGKKAAERLANRSILITGGSSGIGKAVAETFASASNGQIKLILGARRQDRLTQLSDELKAKYPNIKIHHDFLDVTVKSSIAKFISNIPQDFEPDCLLNNAGKALGRSEVGSITDEDISGMIETNITGLVNMTQAILPIFKKNNKGDIVNIGSVAGRMPYAQGSVYCGSKSFVSSFTGALRRELISTQIRVIEVDPGAVNTEFSTVRFHGDKNQADATYEGQTPLVAEDIAEIIVFACTRKENTVIADTLVFPNGQASPIHHYRKPKE